MKKFLSLFLCAIVVCGCGLNVNAAGISFYNENEEVPNRMEMELTYLCNFQKPIFNDFDLIDDGLIIVSKNVQNPTYDSYRNIIAEAESKIMPKLSSCEEREIPVVILSRDDDQNITEYFKISQDVDAFFDVFNGCVVVWEDKFNLDEVEYQLYCATIGHELGGHTPYWLNCAFYVEFTNWLRRGNDPEIVNEIISDIRDEKYDNPIDFFDEYENTDIFPLLLGSIKEVCDSAGCSFEEVLAEVGIFFED